MIAVGDRIPSVKFKRILADGSTVELDTATEFAGKKVILFGLPGPFTPTCHAQHVPSYIARHDELVAKGVAAIVCMSVSDHWVMRAWADALHTDGKVDMLADGNGELTRAMGLEVDLSGAKMGPRCRRFSSVIEDGVVTSIEVEPGKGIDVTGADACLTRLG
jgi:peroxiredoxin